MDAALDEFIATKVMGWSKTPLTKTNKSSQEEHMELYVNENGEGEYWVDGWRPTTDPEACKKLKLHLRKRGIMVALFYSNDKVSVALNNARLELISTDGIAGIGDVPRMISSNVGIARAETEELAVCRFAKLLVKEGLL